MPWFRVDDQLHSHPKWLATSPRARALWTTAGSWSSAQLTDGHVPRHVLPVLGGQPKDAKELVERGLWRDNGDGWVFHDWDEFQPTKAEVEERKAGQSEGGAWANHKRWHLNRDQRSDDCEYCNGRLKPKGVR